ncbi:MAG: agmatine deiminase family protein, partial [Pseudomonadota bacterium]
NEVGYWVPDEAEPHLRTFMQWPVNTRVHPDPIFLEMVQQAIADVANTIAEFEPVVMLMDEGFESVARRKLSSDIEIWDVPTDDLWARDSGPLFVRNKRGDLAIRHMNFNGWGGKQDHRHDGQVARRIAERMELPLLDNGLVGEPGGVETDGHGTLIAHESSWVNPNRNVGTCNEIEVLLLEAMGADRMIWAPGVAGADITDYHIDSLARFAGLGQVIIQLPEEVDERDPWSAAAFETYDILKQATNARDEPLEITVIPEPYDVRVTDQDFVASYVNYYICNGGIIAAEFGDRDTDSETRATLQRLYPDREIVMLNVDPIGEVGGGIHCATQQQPAV